MRNRRCARAMPWYREPMMWLVMMIPASSVVMGAVMLGFAVTSYDGLVADDYYKQGLEINRSLARDELAARRGLEAEVAAAGGAAELRALLRSNDGFEYPDTLHLRLFHATRSGLDRHILLRRTGLRTYTGRRPELAAGHWYVQLDSGGWRLKGELYAPAPELGLRLAPLRR